MGEGAEPSLQTLADWCVQVNATHERRRNIAGWVSFVRPQPLDYEDLVDIERPRSEMPE